VISNGLCTDEQKDRPKAVSCEAAPVDGLGAAVDALSRPPVVWE
jgi:hypothetical protein